MPRARPRHAPAASAPAAPDTDTPAEMAQEVAPGMEPLHRSAPPHHLHRQTVRRGSASSESSSSSAWSGDRRGRRAPRALPLPTRPVRRIAKAKESIRRPCGAAARRAAARRAADALRQRRATAASEELSDVGADSSDSDQWTELDGSTSESSSVKEPVGVANELDQFNGFDQKPQEAEAPPMGQFLLPLLGSADTGAASDHFLIRHEDILQLLASAEESSRADAPESSVPDTEPPPMQPVAAEGPFPVDGAAPLTPLTPEEEAVVLRYVCEAERQQQQTLAEGEQSLMASVEDWLMGMYRCWCELNALMYTMIGAASIGIDMGNDGWLYRARFSCHCRLCIGWVHNGASLARHIDAVVVALARGESTMGDALTLIRALGLHAPGGAPAPGAWQLAAAARLSRRAARVVHRHLQRLSAESELARQMMFMGCLCRPREMCPLDEQSAVSCFIKMLECFKMASHTLFRVEILSAEGTSDERLDEATYKLEQYLAPYQRSSVSARLADMAAKTEPSEVGVWSGYKHRCECLTPRTLCAQQRKQLLRVSFFGMLQVVGRLEMKQQLDSARVGDKSPCKAELEGTSRELVPDGQLEHKPPDAELRAEAQMMALVEYAENCLDGERGDEAMDIGADESDAGSGSGSGSLGLSTSSSLDSASELLLAAAAAVESASEAEAAPGELCRTVRHLMRSIASIERLMDRVLRHCDAVWPLAETDECRKRVDTGLTEVDRKLMAMYRRLPEVHQKQLQVYRKQKKLSTVCMQLVGGRPPAPPPPGSPPPSCPASPPPSSPTRQTKPRLVCPEYHLRRFKEVRRKVMHMRDQQLYYPRLRIWLEGRLRRGKPSGVQGSASPPQLEEPLARRRIRRSSSPRHARKPTAAKRKLRHTSETKPVEAEEGDREPESPEVFRHEDMERLKHELSDASTIIGHKILQMLCAETRGGDEVQPSEGESPSQEEDRRSEVDPPEVFCYENAPPEAHSDADTVVGEKDDLCKEMKECLARFANFALSGPEVNLNETQSAGCSAPVVNCSVEVQAESLRPDTLLYPDSVSPPLQEVSPTCSEQLPVYRAPSKPSQRIVTLTEFLNRSASVIERLRDQHAEMISKFDKNTDSPLHTHEMTNSTLQSLENFDNKCDSDQNSQQALKTDTAVPVTDLMQNDMVETQCTPVVSHSIPVVNHGGTVVNNNEAVINNGETVENHGETVLNHGETVVNHGEMVGNYGVAVVNHSETLGNHDEIVGTQSEMVVNQVEMVVNQCETVKNATETPEDLEAIDAILEQFGDFKLTPAETAAVKDPRVHKYVTFGLEIKRAIEECQNIINSCNSYIRVSENGDITQIPDSDVKRTPPWLQRKTEDELPHFEDQEILPMDKDDGSLSFEQIYEAIMSLDKNSTDLLECMDKKVDHSAEPIDIALANGKLIELYENMPQILASMPDIANKFSNVSFELPEFATILHTLPEVNNEAQLTPETLKQIRELKTNKLRDTVKVTKHTNKRKNIRKVKSADNDVIGTITFDIDSKEISDMFRDEKDLLLSHLKNKQSSNDDYRDLIMSVSSQVVTNKAFEIIRQSKNPELAKCLEEGWKMREMMIPKNNVKNEPCSKATTLFDNSVKTALSMEELRELVKSRFSSWKHYVAAKLKNVPMEVVEAEIEDMLGKFYSYIEDLAEKQTQDCDKIVEKLENEDRECIHKDDCSYKEEDGAKSLDCAKNELVKPCDCLDKNKPSEIESLKQIMKFIKDSVGSTFDIIIMQMSKMSKERKNTVKNLKFKYMDVIWRCAESSEVASWILLDPESAANIILEMTGLDQRVTGESADIAGLSNDKKLEYFMKLLKEMNHIYMRSLHKSSYSGDEWLVLLFRLEQLETKLKEALSKACQSHVKPAQTQTPSNVSETREAELLAGKGLSKIINQANKYKKSLSGSPTDTASPKMKPSKLADKTTDQEKEKCSIESQPDKASAPEAAKPQKAIRMQKERNDYLLAKFEAILTSKGEISLLDSFNTIKSYITSGLPLPEKYKKHVISICSRLDAKLLDEDIEQALSKGLAANDLNCLKVQPEKTKDEPTTDKNTKPTEKCSKPAEKSAKLTEKCTKPPEKVAKPTEKCTKAEKSAKPPDKPAIRVPKCCQPESDELDSGEPPLCCPGDKNGKHFAIIGSQNPELLAKYSAQALRNAKHSLNAVAFNSIRNGSKKDGEPSETNAPKSDCKWTNDCICTSCRNGDGNNSLCLGDIVKQCYDIESRKGKASADGAKPAQKPPAKETKAPVSTQPKGQPAKVPGKMVPPKLCENIHPSGHQQHVCKMGHTSVSSGCANEGNHQIGTTGSDQPCNCCYCTVFGHAPPMTTPVPRNFNETRERLRSILRKKQKGKTAVAASASEPEPQKVPSQPPTPETVQNSPTLVQPKQKPAPPPGQSVLKPPTVTQSVQTTESVGPDTDQNLRDISRHQKNLAAHVARLMQEKKDAQASASTLTPSKPIPLKAPPPRVPPPAAAAQFGLPPHAPPGLTPHAPPGLPPHAPPGLPPPAAHQLQLMQQPLAKLAPARPAAVAVPVAVAAPAAAEQEQLRREQEERRHLELMRAARQGDLSLYSRDTSVFSTSSGCSAVSGWRDGCVSDEGCGHAEDTRDLDALLQYIEGPARHVDRGKKRAKKQRQKAKKMESKLVEEYEELSAAAALRRRLAASARADYNALRRRAEETRSAIKQAQHQQNQGRKKGKKGAKACPVQQAKIQLMAEQLEDLTRLLGQNAKALQEAELDAGEASARLAECEEELREARCQQGGPAPQQPPPQQPPPQHPPPQLAQPQQLQQLHDGSSIVRVRRSPGDGAVTVSLPGQRRETPLVALLHNNPQLSVFGVEPPAEETARGAPKKQSWEAALAHINALAKQPAPKLPKEKVKKPAPAPSDKPSEETSRSHSLTAEQPLSKKQRKLLARQEAEEEEARRKQAEAKAKRVEPVGKKAAEAAARKGDSACRKSEPAAKRSEAPGKKPKEEPKKQELKKAEKETEKAKGKENKAANAGPAAKQRQPAQQAAPAHKKAAADKRQVVNITPDTTIELVKKRGAGGGPGEDNPTACSIMAQLSCGIQVADLRLPPGITLTRVPPSQQPPPANIKSVPLWKCSQLPAAPTPPQRPQPVINADPSLGAAPALETPKPAIVPETHQPVGKSKKAKKKAKKAAAAAADAQPAEHRRADGTKMVTLRNPMFHPNLPAVQVSTQPPKKVPERIRIPDPIPMPPTACQATITPTSNGMYTIRNPLMSMVHQQSLMGIGSQNPNAHLPSPPSYSSAYVVNQNHFGAPPPGAQYTAEPRASPGVERTHFAEERQSAEFRRPEFQAQNSRINLASFAQANDEGYSLFKPSHEETNGRSSAHFPPEPPSYSYIDNSAFVPQAPNPIVSPNPIGTRPEASRQFEPSDSSLFTTKLPDPIGPPLKREEERNDFGIYTPFGQTEGDFRSALFGSERAEWERGGEARAAAGGDSLPYFQRLRVGARLNNEVTIHHVTESKFYKTGSEPPAPEPGREELSSSVFSRAALPPKAWTAGRVTPSPPASSSSAGSAGAHGFPYKSVPQSSGASSVYDSVSNSSSNSPHASGAECAGAGGARAPEDGWPGRAEEADVGYGAVGQAAPIGSQRTLNGLRPANTFYPERSVFAPDRSVDLSALDSSERDIETFKRFDFYFEPPKNKPKIALNVHDIAAQLRPKDK